MNNIVLCLACRMPDNPKQLMKVDSRGYIHQTCFDMALTEFKNILSEIAEQQL